MARKHEKAAVRVAVCDCELMECYQGKFNNGTIKAHGRTLVIREVSVSEDLHDYELTGVRSKKRSHVFLDHNGVGLFAELYDLIPGSRKDRGADVEGSTCWDRKARPRVASVRIKLGKLIEREIKPDDLDAWLKRMRPKRKKVRKRR